MNLLDIKQQLDEAIQEIKSELFQTAYQKLTSLLEALKQYASSDQEAKKLRSQVEKEMAEILMMQGNNSLALLHAQSALSLAEEGSFTQEMGTAYLQMGKLYNRLSQFDRAIEFLNLAFELTTTAGDMRKYAAVNNVLANSYLALGDYEKAFEYYERALDTFKQIKDHYGEAVVTANIGIVYFNIEKYDKAVDYFERGYEMHISQGLRLAASNSLVNRGNGYAKLGDFEKSVECYESALQIALEFSEKKMEGQVLASLGNSLIHLGDYQKGFSCFQKAAQIQLELGDDFNRAHSLINLAKLLLDEKFEGHDVQQALHLLQESEQLSLAVKAKSPQASACLILSVEMEKLGRLQDALDYLRKYLSLEKELMSEQAARQALQMEYKRKIADAERDRQLKLTAFKTKENILHRMLPPQIAERLSEGEEQIADYFPSVSILFADIEGFTPISADMPAHMVVRFLNHVFSQFDEIMKKHGCEKIKTIGDGYMAVAGAPVECADHAERIAQAALDMMKAMDLPEDVLEFLPEGKVFSIRIGIHTGSVVGAVVGNERFVYDIYSDAVNTAARMESHGQSGKIHVSAEFMKQLSNRLVQTKNNNHGIRFEKRGEMEIKGKDKMKTYFMLGPDN